MRNDIWHHMPWDWSEPHYRSPSVRIELGMYLMPSLKTPEWNREEENPDIIKNLKTDWSPKCWEIKLDQCDPGRDRVMPNPVAGTTRDAIDTHLPCEWPEFTMIRPVCASQVKSMKTLRNICHYVPCVHICDRSDVRFWWSLMPEKGWVWQADRWLCSWSWQRYIVVIKMGYSEAQPYHEAVGRWHSRSIPIPLCADCLCLCQLNNACTRIARMIKQISESQNTRIPSAVLNDVIGCHCH